MFFLSASILSFLVFKWKFTHWQVDKHEHVPTLHSTTVHFGKSENRNISSYQIKRSISVLWCTSPALQEKNSFICGDAQLLARDRDYIFVGFFFLGLWRNSLTQLLFTGCCSFTLQQEQTGWPFRHSAPGSPEKRCQGTRRTSSEAVGEAAR